MSFFFAYIFYPLTFFFERLLPQTALIIPQPQHTRQNGQSLSHSKGGTAFPYSPCVNQPVLPTNRQD